MQTNERLARLDQNLENIKYIMGENDEWENLDFFEQLNLSRYLKGLTDVEYTDIIEFFEQNKKVEQ